MLDEAGEGSRAQGLVDVERPGGAVGSSPACGPPEATRWAKTALYADGGTVGSL